MQNFYHELKKQINSKIKEMKIGLNKMKNLSTYVQNQIKDEKQKWTFLS